MSTKDIRDSDDLGTASGTRLANANLQGCPPCSNWKASGFDCLIVVLRRIYGHCMLDPEVRASLKLPEHPILDHAWYRFGNDPVEVAEADVERLRVFDELAKTPVRHTASFKKQCCSELMNTTFWSHDICRLIDIPLDLEGEPVECSSEDIVRMSLLKLDHAASPDLSIQTVIGDAFGVKKPFGKGKEVLFRPSRPWIVRFFYKSAVEEEKRLKFYDLRHIQLPIWQHRPAEGGFFMTGKVDYVLIAVVRLSDEENPKDFVRTYALSGANILGEYEPKSFMDNKWSVSDPSAGYMLFYGVANRGMDPDGLLPFPEISEPEQPDPETLQALDDCLFPLIAAGLSNQQPEAQGSRSGRGQGNHPPQGQGRGRKRDRQTRGRQGPPPMPFASDSHSVQYVDKNGHTATRGVNTTLLGGNSNRYLADNFDGTMSGNIESARDFADLRQHLKERNPDATHFHITAVPYVGDTFETIKDRAVFMRTTYQRGRRPDGKADFMPAYLPVQPTDSGDTCLNCDSNSHVLKRCLKAKKGDIGWCTICNGKHNVDQCERYQALTLTDKVTLLVKERVKMPSLRGTEKWWKVLHDFCNSPEFPGKDAFTHFPWSRKYARDLFATNGGELCRALQKEFDARNGNIDLLPSDGNTNSWENIYETFWKNAKLPWPQALGPLSGPAEDNLQSR
ncbi:hypothetical protein ACHAPU_010974 [Fusarium lateritium]